MEPWPARAGDGCAPNGRCPPAAEVDGPHGPYTPELTCVEGLCAALPREWCNDRDDTGEGEVDEGCALEVTEVPLDSIRVPIRLLERGEVLGLLDGIDETRGRTLHVLDADLTETSAFPIPDHIEQLVAARDGFVGLGRRITEPAALEVVRWGLDGTVIRTLSLGPALDGSLLAHGDDPIRLVTREGEVHAFDATSGEALGVATVGERELVGAVGPSVVLCDASLTLWVSPLLEVREVPGGCTLLASPGGELSFWGFSSDILRDTEDGGRQTFAAPSTAAPFQLLLTATEEHADLWMRSSATYLRVTRVGIDGSEAVRVIESSGETVLDAAAVADLSVALVTGAAGTRLLVVGPAR